MAASIQHLSLAFKCREHSGKIHVTLQPNLDRSHAWGLDLIFPSIPESSYPTQLLGFPVIHAEIEYPTTPSPCSGYGSIFGWIQLVKATRLNAEGEKKEGEWEMDIYQSFKEGSNSPFVYWGYKPVLFDAPARLVTEKVKAEDAGLIWRAQSFLCVIDDVGLGRSVRLCEGAGFGWGFDIRAVSEKKTSGASREIHIVDAKPLDLETEWSGRVEILRRVYPDWEFH